jgi:hydrogenase maturation protein HypF
MITPRADVVGLTGGVFANRLLTNYLTKDLTTQGCRVVTHQIVPSNDGGLALGQVLAGVLIKQGD